jgi:hypothetical protein
MRKGGLGINKLRTGMTYIFVAKDIKKRKANIGKGRSRQPTIKSVCIQLCLDQYYVCITLDDDLN